MEFSGVVWYGNGEIVLSNCPPEQLDICRMCHSPSSSDRTRRSPDTRSGGILGSCSTPRHKCGTHQKKRSRVYARWKIKTFLAGIRTVKLDGQRIRVRVGELPEAVRIAQIRGDVLPCAQVGGRLDDIRGAGAVRKIQRQAGIRIFYDAIDIGWRNQSIPIDINVTGSGLWVVTENRELLALESSG